MRSATAIVDRFMLADGMDGMTEASATDRSSTCGRTRRPAHAVQGKQLARRVTGGQDGRPTATVVRSSPCRKWQSRDGRCEGQIWSCGLSPRPDARRDPARRSGPVPGSRWAAGGGRPVAEGSGDDPLVRYLWSPATRTLVPACGHPRREEPLGSPSYQEDVLHRRTARRIGWPVLERVGPPGESPMTDPTVGDRTGGPGSATATLSPVASPRSAVPSTRPR